MSIIFSTFVLLQLLITDYYFIFSSRSSSCFLCPKLGGVTGDQVGQLFAEKRFLEIAKYNVGDLLATKKLFEKWEKYIKF